MNPYELVKFIETVGGVDARKRLQKCLYLLRAKGCRLDSKDDAGYYLHLYGPYSPVVADLTNDLTQAKVLEETESPNAQVGATFSYRITEKGRELVQKYESTPGGKDAKERLEQSLDVMKQLRKVDLRTLELASTIAFYRIQGNSSWEEAKSKTATFKKVLETSSAMNKAFELAREILGEFA